MPYTCNIHYLYTHTYGKKYIDIVFIIFKSVYINYIVFGITVSNKQVPNSVE